jgi:hypothetical protein
MAIDFGVHKHLMVDGNCKEFVAITREVDRTLDVKIYAISLNANKIFLAKHLLDDSGNGMVELLHDEQLKKIQDKFFELSSPNVHFSSILI